MLRIENISFTYNTQKVINEVNFNITEAQIVSVMGASGSGKSTLLKLVYGLLDANEGKLFWKDQQILGPKFHLVPGMDNMKYLAQDFDLMPYVSAAENVGRFLSNFYLTDKANRISELLELVGMTAFTNTKAQFLSGGQMQRIALARVLALEPEVLLLDEPFSHIDAFQKSILSRHLFSYCKQKGITVMFTSHTPEEALMFSDQILVMKNGEIVEQDTPQNIYYLPKNEYIASLTGEVNVIPVKYLGVANDEVLLLRPHQIKISTDGYEAQVLKSYFKGNGYLLEVLFNDIILFINSETDLLGKIYFKI